MQKIKKLFAASIAGLFLAGAVQAATVTLAVQDVTKGGTTTVRTSVESANTYKFRNDGHVFIQFIKTGASTSTATIVTQATVSGLAVSDQTITVDEIDGDVTAGPFPTALFNDSSGDVSLTVTNTATISIAVVKH